MYRPIVPAPPSTPSQPTPPPDLRSRQNTIANAKGKRRALIRRSTSLEFLNEQWNGPYWLPFDVRAGLASEPADAQAGGALRVAVEQDLELKTKHLAAEAERPEPHLTVATARAVLKRLRATRLDRSRAASLESAPEFNDFPDLPDNHRDVPDKNLQRAQAAHSAAATALAQLQGKQETFIAARNASESYFKGLREELDAHYFQTDEDGPPLKRRQSTIIDHVKRDHYAHLEETSQHYQNALIQETNLTREISIAQDHEQQAYELMETAKTRVTSIAHMWEAKIQRDEALKAQKKYRELEKKRSELEEEMMTVGDQLYAKRQAADEWKSVAEDEDWEGIWLSNDWIGLM
ncbi:uncharacterized protein FRV6_16800 [Fusarium oxysporum]|uniref:Uncharacterized protein n=1 Tax=Fusarium oxysporum TaxID=5507 RepID=A0A2H3TVL4_FUSOX|nr:uncharacterized protein FRV6_16800 [Fusarium oxysporum]